MLIGVVFKGEGREGNEEEGRGKKEELGRKEGRKEGRQAGIERRKFHSLI